MSASWSVSGCGPGIVVYDEALTGYDFGPSHPMQPRRVDLAVALAESLGLFDRGLGRVAAPDATEDDLLVVHEPAFVDAVRRAAQLDPATALGFGLGSDDDPIFPRMHEASRHVVGASLEAARQVWSGQAQHAANVAGGLHHAMPDRASGFCVYNDVAIAIRHLLDSGAERVAYVDVDVHHGDGVEHVFYDDPRVLTVSVHETGRFLFPGTGFPADNGGPGAEGTAVNVALPPGTADAGWLRAFHAVVPPLVREFAPQILVTQHGCDSHRDDPLADLALSLDGQVTAYQALHALAHEVCAGKWVAFGGGGYAVVDVVPRAWAHLLGLVGGTPVPFATATPQDWRDLVVRRYDARPPLRMTDAAEGGGPPRYRSWDEGYDPDSWLDRAILDTREAVFPTHGLDPMP